MNEDQLIMHVEGTIVFSSEGYTNQARAEQQGNREEPGKPSPLHNTNSNQALFAANKPAREWRQRKLNEDRRRVRGLEIR